MMLQLGGGWVSHPFDDEYFDLWSRQIIAIVDYYYAGIDFSQDHDMVVPPGSQLRAISTYFCFLNVF